MQQRNNMMCKHFIQIIYHSVNTNHQSSAYIICLLNLLLQCPVVVRCVVENVPLALAISCRQTLFCVNSKTDSNIKLFTSAVMAWPT